MLIGLAGKKQVGKNLVGKILLGIDEYHHVFVNSETSMEECVTHHICNEVTHNLSGMRTVSFAAKLKQIAAIIFNVDHSWFEDERFKNSTIPERFINCRVRTYREALQYIGTDLFRDQFCKNIWITSTLSNYNPESSRWIVTDVRFPDEIEAIKKLGGKVVYINRPTKAENKIADLTAQHASETALSSYTEYDYSIRNDGSLDDLYGKVERFYNAFILNKK